MTPPSRESMLKKVSNLQEFKEDELSPDSLTNEELGAVLGYWDVGDGTYEDPE